MLYRHNGLLYILKIERNSVACYNMNELWGDNPDTKGQMLCDCAYVRHLEELSL
jgi:hypothetical protein